MKPIKLFFCNWLILFACAGVFAGEASKWREVLPGHEFPPDSPLKPEYAKAIELSTPMADALYGYAPGFVFWEIGQYPPKQVEHYPYAANSLPYAVKGDFNGDGEMDAVVAGHDRDGDIVVVLLSSSTDKYYPVQIKRRGCYPDARKAGKPLEYKPTNLLVFKPKGIVVPFSDSAANDRPLEFDGFKIKHIRDCYCDDKEYAYYLKCRDWGDDGTIYAWDRTQKLFLNALGMCDGNPENDYRCF
ncbi:MAG: hypothetical protein PHW69_04830 [Elusimicrobiaceae bacterium]|nr:hypothetical protein [Elusimicrobiaceae bacterium]